MNWDLQQDHDLISAGDDRILQTFHNDTDNDLTHAPVASPTTKGGAFPTADSEEEEGVMRFGIIVLSPRWWSSRLWDGGRSNAAR